MRVRSNGGVIGPKTSLSPFAYGGDTGITTSIRSLSYCDSGYNVLDDTAVSTSGGYIKLIGVGFSSGYSLYVGGVLVASTTLISSTEIRAVLPANVNGSYSLTLFNAGGSGAIWASGVIYSGFPSFTTGTYSNVSTTVSVQLLVTGDAPLVYSLQGGSTLPSGVTLSSSGLLSGTVSVSVDTIYTFTVLVNDAQLQTTQQIITLSVVLSDQYYKNTVLALHGDGTNGSNNNTFLDSSTNNFTITRTGTPTQGTFTPFSQTGWSGYFNSANSDYISNSAQAGLGSGSFTVEFWCYIPTSTDKSFIGNVAGGGYTNWQIVYYSASTTLRFSGWYNVVMDWTISLPLNSWNHIAVSRNGSTFAMFLNGTRSPTTVTDSTNYSTTGLWIGREGDGVNYVTGYLSNVRIVTGTYVYNPTSTTITVPTSPLTAISGTTLLTLQDNRFKDNSSNTATLTLSGSPSIQAFSPFAPTAAYSTSTVGGSIYFNGSTDFISKSAADALTGSFTIEYWVYFNSTTGYQTPITANDGATTSILHQTYLTTFYFFTPNSGSTAFTTFTFSPYQWYHIAMVRSGSTVTAYVNGTALTPTTTLSGNINPTYLAVGDYTNGPAYPFNGYISNVRLVKSAVYTGNFTPSTTPLTAITNTSLLLKGTNAGIYDNASKNDLITAGSAQVSTANSKFGGSSMFFNGTTDYLTTIDTPNLQLGTGDFTVEAWVYVTTASTSRGIVAKGPTAATTGWECKINAANFFRFEWTASSLVGSSTIPINTWTHVAVVRFGSATGNVKLYVNGAVYATSPGAVTDNFTQTDVLKIGNDRAGTSFWPGYIDDLRITKGVARYTANFTPATAAFQDQ